MTTLFGNTAITATIIPATPAVSAASAKPKKHNLLPVLVVLFLISYGLMTMLIVEQGRTIESQRALIHELFHDSQELAAVKGRTLQQSGVVESQTQIPSTQIPSTQAQAPKTQAPFARTPSTQTPSTQTPSTQAHATPSTQVAPRSRVQARGGKMAQPQLQAPSRPASDLADDRRALKTI